MRKPPKSAYEFSDDFEVTYEEDISSKYKVNPESDEDSRSGVRTETMTQPMPRVRDSRRYDLSIEDPDDGYDGYYEDIRPVDENMQKEKMDTTLIWKVTGVLTGLLVIIGACVALMYVL